ncbi:hypothetical protein VDG1235_1189 [Verrucomicrobiia bacterium DG1235]|nr:hypothetical protein VDG1235_1189 [Verrucomicrobiae bacterium DG1235]
MVLEDDKTTSHIIAWPLMRLGYSVVEAHEAHKAIEFVGEDKVDLVVCDMMLPDMKGTDALREMVKASGNVYLKAVFVTSLLSKLAKKGHEAKIEVDGLHYPALGKPVRPEVVRAIVERLVGGPN